MPVHRRNARESALEWAHPSRSAIWVSEAVECSRRWQASSKRILSWSASKLVPCPLKRRRRVLGLMPNRLATCRADPSPASRVSRMAEQTCRDKSLQRPASAFVTSSSRSRWNSALARSSRCSSQLAEKASKLLSAPNRTGAPAYPCHADARWGGLRVSSTTIGFQAGPHHWRRSDTPIPIPASAIRSAPRIRGSRNQYTREAEPSCSLTSIAPAKW